MRARRLTPWHRDQLATLHRNAPPPCRHREGLLSVDPLHPHARVMTCAACGLPIGRYTVRADGSWDQFRYYLEDACA